MLKLNKIYCGDAFDKLQELPDDSIDLIASDPQYGWSFMGKDWDKALPRQEIYNECLRVLKHGAFMFWMSGARLDGLTENGIRIRNAGFKTDFTPLFWAYATGFPKAQNIPKWIDKRACKKELTEKLGRKPTKEEFEEAWKGFRDVVGKDKGHTGEQVKNHLGVHDDDNYEWGGDYNTTIPKTSQAKLLDGSYAGFQPKPAVEVIIVAMKPLSEKSYTDQALKNKKGITWLDDGRIPSNGLWAKKANPECPIYGREGGVYMQSKTMDIDRVGDSNGRFSANLLVEDDVLNDGRDIPKSRRENVEGKAYRAEQNINFYGNKTQMLGYSNSGSFSRYFSLDAWWEERIKQLPEEVQKTFPFLIVPKASKSERNKGLEGLPTKSGSEVTGRKEGSAGLIMKGRVNNPYAGASATYPKQNHHPTVKPLKLMTYLITLGSREEDLVLDPFMGSGTTAVACKMLNRNFIGFEISSEYVEIAEARLRGLPKL